MSEHAPQSRRTETEPGDAPDDAAVLATDIELGYAGVEEPVVDCDTVVVPEGEVTALVGPNGSGKSTLLKGLSRDLTPDEGEVLLDGRAVQEYGTKEYARRLGVLSQQNESPGDTTVERLVAHGRYPHRGAFEGMSEADHEAVERAMERAGVVDLRDEQVGNLSGGQKQLAFIAMVLAQETDVLLLDEPTTYLDLHHQLRVMEVVRDLNESANVTVCIVLHDITQAARYADYLVALDDGEIYDWGPPEDVVTEQLLADVFEVDAVVEYDSEPRIVPRRARTD
ncbi:MAG: ABC transporter ATP-binding protein [Halobacteriaceae archaeon]